MGGAGGDTKPACRVQRAVGSGQLANLKRRGQKIMLRIKGGKHVDTYGNV
jgi:hypothetical protein